MRPQAEVVPDAVEQAVAAFQAGCDREGNFRRIVEGYYHPLRGFFARRVFSTDDCLELTQETFLRIYRGLDGFRHQALFRSWVYRIAHTTYLKWLQQRQRAAAGSAPEALGDPSLEIGMEDQQPVVIASENPLDQVLREEARRKLSEAVDELPEQERRCVTLRTYHDLSLQEIADFLGLQVGTVKAHLHHARQKLRTRLQSSFDGIDL